MKRELGWIGMTALTLAGALIAQASAAPKDSGQSGEKKTAGGSARAVEHGKEVFTKKCAVCHYSASEAKKIGPGLKGMNKRGTFTVNSAKVTDESLKTWIENGDSLMPGFKDVLMPDEIKDLVRYVRTL